LAPVEADYHREFCFVQNLTRLQLRPVNFPVASFAARNLRYARAGNGRSAFPSNQKYNEMWIGGLSL
jgi:hypothetical protein